RRVRWLENKSDQLTCRRNIVEWPEAGGSAAKVCEIARAKVLRKVPESGRQSRRVGVEFSPQMKSAIEAEVCFKYKPITHVSLQANVGLVTFGYTQSGIEAARKSEAQSSKLLYQRGISSQNIGKSKVL